MNELREYKRKLWQLILFFVTAGGASQPPPPVKHCFPRPQATTASEQQQAKQKDDAKVITKHTMSKAQTCRTHDKGNISIRPIAGIYLNI